MNNIFTQKDYMLFKQICNFSEYGLYHAIETILKKFDYKTIICKTNYIIAIGDLPVALVAHLDTVFGQGHKELFYDKKKNAIWSPDGLGADDRAGIFAIIKILQKQYKPTVIFTLGEELGGVGAHDIIMDFPTSPINLKYIIELDRQGKDECVFYRCDNPEFTKYIIDFGFKKAKGTFTDISIICPQWEIAGVNLSIGYLNEHSYSEILFVNWLFGTINKVIYMLEVVSEAKFYKWIGEKAPRFNLGLMDDTCLCAECKRPYTEYDLYKVMKNNKRYKQLCIDCLSASVNWCEMCAEPFEMEPEKYEKYCYKCREGIEDYGDEEKTS